MSEPVPIPPPGFDALSVEEQVDYVLSLWDRIAADPARVPVPDWHREVLGERLEAYRSDPEGGQDWGEVRERVRRLLERQSSE